MTVWAHAQYETTLEVTDAPSAAVKASMEQNGTKLLTELNNAQGENRTLSLAGININNQAAESLMIMWEVCPFRCDEVEIIERCLHIGNNQDCRYVIFRLSWNRVPGNVSRKTSIRKLY